MAYYNATVEPYQEQAGAQTAASNPDELQAFYADMQKREVERKKSKRMSHTGSIWSRKSVKRSAGQATAVATRASSSQPQQQQHQRPPASSSSVSLAKDTAVGAQPAGNSNDREMEKQDETRDVATPLTMSRSIIPDALNELPAWYSKDDSATYMMRYNLHNPVGPRRYYNHHLIPPSQKKPASRPPSIFSPSFPPMATSSQDSDDLTRLAGPSRTPSHSPLPTPSSSQVGVGDVGGVPRSRKTSQTAHDGVDLLDVSDPWGTNWHHQSPYDIGLTHNVVSVDPQERSRHTSVTTRETRRRTVTPSPLSQSTSAIHLAPPSESGRIHRKLSKRRTSTLGLFGHGDSKSLSAPTTPLDEKLSSMSIVDTRDILGPSVSAPPSAFKSASLLSKKERRGSVLGRIVKKFSILRKSHPIEKEDSHNMVVVRSHSPEKAAQKRVPPPVLDEPLVASPEPLPTPPTPPTPLPEEQPREREQPQEREYRLSLSSIEQPISMGKLTIANPDVPSLNSTPQQQHMPLPAETESTVVPESPPIPSHSYHHFPTPAQPAPSIQSSTAHAPSMGTASPVPSSSMQVLSETMRPDVRTSPQKLIPSSPTQLRRKSSPTKAEHLHGATSPATKRSSQPNGAAFPTAAPPVAANGPSQEKRKSRSPEKKPAPPMVPPKPTAAVVPFPEVQQSTQSQPEPTVPAYLTSMISSYHDVIDNSPMSAASLLVNPPTPNLPIDLPIPPSSPAPTLPPKDFKRSNREPSPSGVSKQTETFKLIRSVSGSVYASTETIIAAGQQWEVVEDKGKNKDASSAKSKTRSKDKDKESRREHRKEKERGEDRESRKHSHKGSRRSADVAMAGAALHNSQRRANSVEIHNRAPIPEFQKPQESSARRSVDIPVNVNKPQPPPPPPTQGVSHSRPLERNPSRSARPTSEVPTAADLNATRGREAWEMERLFKAQSMYGMGATIGLTASAPVVAPPIVHDATSKASHGSGHTSYTVQNAFSNQPASHIYHSIPSHSQSFPQNLDRSANDIRHTAPSFSTSHSSPADLLPVSRPNPLPEPPRDSPYQPGNIDALLDSTTSDYWTKFTGVTTAH